MKLADRAANLARAILPAPVQERLRGSSMVRRGLDWWRERRVGRMTVGIGAGLRFSPGPSNPDYASGANELPVQDALSRHLRRGDVFFDVGANVGFLTVIGARLVGPTGRVLAFEPVPENAALVRKNARLNGFAQVEVIERAVFHSSGRGQIALAQYSGGSSLVAVGAPPDASGQVISVEMVTIDDVVFAEKWPAPRFVKIDVEGAELDVLEGMRRVLAEVRPILLYELDDEDASALADKLARCRSFVEAFGYSVSPLADSYAGGTWKVGHAVAIPL